MISLSMVGEKTGTEYNIKNHIDHDIFLSVHVMNHVQRM
jgi:hypothetical protein